MKFDIISNNIMKSLWKSNFVSNKDQKKQTKKKLKLLRVPSGYYVAEKSSSELDGNSGTPKLIPNVINYN